MIPRVVLVSPIVGTHPIMKVVTMWETLQKMDRSLPRKRRGLTAAEKAPDGTRFHPESGLLGGSPQEIRRERLDSRW